MARKYSKEPSRTVGRVLHQMKEGTLRSGGSGKKVKSRKQAIAHRAFGGAQKVFGARAQLEAASVRRACEGRAFIYLAQE